MGNKKKSDKSLVGGHSISFEENVSPLYIAKLANYKRTRREELFADKNVWPAYMGKFDWGEPCTPYRRTHEQIMIGADGPLKLHKMMKVLGRSMPSIVKEMRSVNRVTDFKNWVRHRYLKSGGPPVPI